MENTALKEPENTSESGQDVLVVVSKLKSYIRTASAMNTAGGVAGTLSTLVKGLCDKAIENAKNDGRKTVMERDFKTATGEAAATSEDVLVVVSKLKGYVRSASEMNTAGGVAGTLSTLVKGLCDQAIESAKNDGRKTVMERDFSTVSAN